jgi:hypothetical protein
MAQVISDAPNGLTIVADAPTVVQVIDQPYVLDIVVGALPGPSGFALPRRTSTVTSSATDSSAHFVVIALALGYRVYAVTTSVAARVRLYSTAAGQIADVARTTSVDPGPGSGVVLDLVTPNSGQFILSPEAMGASLESIPSVNIPMTISATVAGPVTVIVLWVPTE